MNEDQKPSLSKLQEANIRQFRRNKFDHKDFLLSQNFNCAYNFRNVGFFHISYIGLDASILWLTEAKTADEIQKTFLFRGAGGGVD